MFALVGGIDAPQSAVKVVGQSLTMPLLFIGAGIAIIGIALLVLRHALLKRRYMRGGEHANVTMMITIPKFKSEEQAKKEENAQGTKEAIAIAEAFFAAVGSIKHHWKFSEWFWNVRTTWHLRLLHTKN